MSLLSAIVASFNPRTSNAALPPTATPPFPALPTHSAAKSGIEGACGVRDLPPDVAYEAQPVSIAAMPQLRVGAVIESRAEAVREIGLYDFDAVRLQLAVSPATAPVRSQPASAVQIPNDQPQTEPVMQAASIYTRAFHLLMADNGGSTQQRILNSL